MEWTQTTFQKSPFICILVDGCVSMFASILTSLYFQEGVLQFKCKKIFWLLIEAESTVAWIRDCIILWSKSWESLMWLGKSGFTEQFGGGKKWSCIWKHTFVSPSTERTQHGSEAAQLGWCVTFFWSQLQLKAPVPNTLKDEQNCRWLVALLSGISLTGAFL